MGLKNIVKLMLIGITALATVTLSMSDVHAKTIICGKKLCTIGDKSDYQRKCVEIKNIKKDKCDYKCMGYKEPRPSDCYKDNYECKFYATSRDGCAQENGGREVDPQNKPKKYRNYTEAKYTSYEKNHMPNCSEGEAAAKTCICNNPTFGSMVICQKGLICRKSLMIQTHLETGVGQTVDFYCENPEGATNSNMTETNSVIATNGDEIQQQIDANTVDQDNGDDGCKTIEQYWARYTSGCWSCLVVGKLTEAFMNAASAGIDVTKKAGHILLIWGFVLWLAFWALKNVSSFTEIKGGNILNDLLRMGAKVVLAWFCINAGVVAIRNFIVTPIMGVGATIAQNFWSDNSKTNKAGTSISDNMEGFEWEEITEEDEKKMLEFMSTVPAPEYTPVSGSSEMSEEERQAYEENQENFEKFEIPNFLIPGFVGGYITSGAGCRPKAATKGQGSICHHGVDGGGFSSENAQYQAAAAGNIAYNNGSGFGNYAVINHGTKGKYTWTTLYAHMQALPGVRGYVKQSQPIGRIGSTGHSTGKHIHFEIRANNEAVDPLALAGGKIIFMKDICPKCNGYNRVLSSGAEEFLRKQGCSIPQGNDWGSCPRVPTGGWSPNEQAIVIPSSYTTSGGSAEEFIVQVPYTEFTGNSAIMPKSVINSMLWATKVITDNTAQMMVLGNMAMCYSNMEGGGAWTILKFKENNITLTNIFMWLDGAILWLLGFVLTCIVAYYLIDISFKIGLAVLALPLMIGLWPFKVTQGKLAETIAIIAKAAATFAFLAITTYYAIELLAACLGGDDGLQGIYDEYDSIVNHEVSGDARDQIKEKLEDYFHIFSVGFLLMLFGCIYGYKLIRKTTEDLAEKFYSDSTFGGQNPMHKGMTGAASMAHKLDQKWGTGLAKDMAAKKVGEGVKSIAGRGALAAKSAQKSIGGGTRALVNTVRGKGDN